MSKINQTPTEKVVKDGKEYLRVNMSGRDYFLPFKVLAGKKVAFLDISGQVSLNEAAADDIVDMLDEAGVEFDTILNPVSKSNALAHAIALRWNKRKGTDIGYMSEIIIKHKDLELFNWMLDPITYSAGDIHYDFFGNYTQNDKELVDKLYSSERPDLEKDFGALLGKSVRDNEELSKDMYESKRKTNHENISKDMIK